MFWLLLSLVAAFPRRHSSSSSSSSSSSFSSSSLSSDLDLTSGGHSSSSWYPSSSSSDEEYYIIIDVPVPVRQPVVKPTEPSVSGNGYEASNEQSQEKPVECPALPSLPNSSDTAKPPAHMMGSLESSSSSINFPGSPAVINVRQSSSSSSGSSDTPGPESGGSHPDAQASADQAPSEVPMPESSSSSEVAAPQKSSSSSDVPKPESSTLNNPPKPAVQSSSSSSEIVVQHSSSSEEPPSSAQGKPPVSNQPSSCSSLQPVSRRSSSSSSSSSSEEKPSRGLGGNASGLGVTSAVSGELPGNILLPRSLASATTRISIDEAPSEGRVGSWGFRAPGSRHSITEEIRDFIDDLIH